tara:strand:+ start:4390 stop:5535 length:1146 start_codon:yes stop_codon:yes gene_type:complete
MTLFPLAERKWEDFLENKIKNYSAKRNYDYGPLEESSVSKISPYVSHRILLEYQIIKDTISKYKGNNVNKFIEEVYWRIYWKGTLENKPCIWENFITQEIELNDLENYRRAIAGETNIPYFNDWIDELKTHNYLHNHTRMWFASTWIFTLGLPWQLGVRFFFEHLYDGDAASNLLSWRWVAGLQTKGKRYIFSTQNLKKFSNNRHTVKNIINQDIVLEDNFNMVYSNQIYQSDMRKSSDWLIMFENDLHVDSLTNIINRYKYVLIVFLEDKDRIIKLSSAVKNFKLNLLKEFSNKFSNIKTISSIELINELREIRSVDLIYPSIGDNYEFIKLFQKKYKIKVKNLVRPEDLYSWQFAKKGFFKFKENIGTINNFLFKPESV